MEFSNREAEEGPLLNTVAPPWVGRSSDSRGCVRTILPPSGKGLGKRRRQASEGSSGGDLNRKWRFRATRPGPQDQKSGCTGRAGQLQAVGGWAFSKAGVLPSLEGMAVSCISGWDG